MKFTARFLTILVIFCCFTASAFAEGVTLSASLLQEIDQLRMMGQATEKRGQSVPIPQQLAASVHKTYLVLGGLRQLLHSRTLESKDSSTIVRQTLIGLADATSLEQTPVEVYEVAARALVTRTFMDVLAERLTATQAKDLLKRLGDMHGSRTEKVLLPAIKLLGSVKELKKALLSKYGIWADDLQEPTSRAAEVAANLRQVLLRDFAFDRAEKLPYLVDHSGIPKEENAASRAIEAALRLLSLANLQLEHPEMLVAYRQRSERGAYSASGFMNRFFEVDLKLTDYTLEDPAAVRSALFPLLMVASNSDQYPGLSEKLVLQLMQIHGERFLEILTDEAVLAATSPERTIALQLIDGPFTMFRQELSKGGTLQGLLKARHALGIANSDRVPYEIYTTISNEVQQIVSNTRGMPSAAGARMAIEFVADARMPLAMVAHMAW